MFDLETIFRTDQIKQFFCNLFCWHDWTEYYRVQIGGYEKVTTVCTKCGKIKIERK